MSDKPADTPQHIVVYTVTLTITRPVDDPDDERVAAIIHMSSHEERRRLEKDLLRALRTFDGDCDCEVVEVNSYAG